MSPHSLGPLLGAAAVADLVGLFLAAAILAGLQQAFPRPHLGSWSSSWLAGAFRVAGGILSATLPPPLAPPLRWTLSLILFAPRQAARLHGLRTPSWPGRGAGAN
jgi:hypothetical protein